MVHDIFKVIVSLVALAVIASLMALFVSGYLSAFKPQEKAASGSVASGLRGGVHKASPSPTAVPGAYGGQGIPAGMYPAQAPIVPPPMPMQMAMQPQPGYGPTLPEPSPSPTPSPSPSPTPTSTPTPVVTLPPSFGSPIANSPYMTGWNGIIEQLWQILPLIFSGQFEGFPVWPQYWW